MINSARCVVKVIQPDGGRSIVFDGLYVDWEARTMAKYFLEPEGKVRYIGNDDNYIRFSPSFGFNFKLLRMHYCKKHGFIYGKAGRKWFRLNGSIR